MKIIIIIIFISIFRKITNIIFGVKTELIKNCIPYFELKSIYKYWVSQKSMPDVRFKSKNRNFYN